MCADDRQKGRGAAVGMMAILVQATKRFRAEASVGLATVLPPELPQVFNRWSGFFNGQVLIKLDLT